jgi:hypothetical protein
MTIEEVYDILQSKVYYDKEGTRKFTFIGNSIHIDRRAFVPFQIYEENGLFYMIPDTPIADEKELRISVEKDGGNHVDLYGRISGEKMITLEA